MHPNVVGALLNSAIYLVCVFVAGLTGHHVASELALVAMGLTYLSHLAQIQQRWFGDVLVSLSIIAGVCAGLALLF
jgi:hypothetical protein